MRPITNLRQNLQFKLDAKSMRSGFVGLFDAKLGSKNVLNDVYYCLVTGALLPYTRSLKPDSALTKAIASKSDGALRDGDRKRVIKSVLVKNNGTKRLEFKTPLAALNKDFLFTDLSPAEVFSASDLERAAQNAITSIEDTPLGGGKTISGKEVAETFKNITAKARPMLGACLDSIQATDDGGRIIIWGTFLINQKEAEYLTNCKWVEIRLSDIYPTLIDWTASIFGRYTRLPKTISKVSMIASEVKDVLARNEGAVKPRVGVDSIVADIDGRFYVIPEVDQSAEYEQQLLDFGLRDDGSYSWSQVRSLGAMTGGDGGNGEGGDEEDSDNDEEGDKNEVEDTETSVKLNDMVGTRTGKKLPANIPIFSDWLNDKFVYSNTAGNLAVYDLSDTVPASEFHFTTFFSTQITGDEGRGSGNAATMSQMVNIGCDFDRSILREMPTAADATTKDREEFMRAVTAANVNVSSFKSAMVSAFRIMEIYLGRNDDGQVPVERSPNGTSVKFVTFEDLVPNSQYDAFKFIGRIVERAAQSIEENVETLYSRMSVMSALQLVAFARMMKNHAKHAKIIRQQDQEKRAKYIHQGVDPNYQTDALPNIKDELIFLPHQAKVDNVLRDHPECAALPVDAGGGKTIQILTNILRELKHKVCKRPIIACPSTLVDQYVKEAVFVTEGKINIIPVTNSTMRMHGPERLAEMIEKAPPNTIVVTDFDFVKGKGKNVAYGNKSVIVWQNAEWLRQFEFDLIAIDESHKLKNLKSARRIAMSRLMQDIKYKRIASGTLVDDTLTDLVSQIALFDPTIFGSKEAFNAKYGENTRGEKVLAWRKGAQREIQQKISEHVVWAQARRKEWSALLPPMEEEFHAVSLSENQRLLYDSILKETVDLIEEAMAKDPDLKEAMESGDETLADDLESMLRPYLVRLERFLSAPETDELASVFLQKDEDKISPKVRKIHQLCQMHLDRNLPGKVVIFTNYTASAEAVYKYAPDDLKKLMIHYTAGRKMECRAQFESDDRKRIMVGQSSSMDTGINFQHCSRLIRMETIWTPGTLEQGNSRINRPQLKKKETRNAVWLDWLMVNRTIDVTKVARLTAKIISKSKFDNADVEAYQELPDLPVIPMKISTIAEQNDFQEELLPYLEAYNSMRNVRDADYAAYREENEGKLHPVKIPQAGVLPGSKLMSRIPYIPGMTIYGTDQLGLVRYDEFCNIDLEDLELEETEIEDAKGNNDDEPDDVAADDPKKAEKLRHKQMLRLRWAKELELAMSMPCHTEFGDGVIYGARKRVWVELRNGDKLRVPKLQTFVITRTTTNNKDMRKELLKAVGAIPLTEPIDVPVEVGNETNKRKRKQLERDLKEGKRGGRKEVEEEVVEDKAPDANFQFTVINDMMAIMFDVENSSAEAAAAMQNYGFKISPDYWMARIRGPKIMLRLFNTWHDKGYLIDKQTSSHLKRIWAALKVDKSKVAQAGFASNLDITHFHRNIIKPSADPKTLKVFPMVQDGRLYMVLPKKGQTANAKAKSVVVPEIKWIPGGGNTELLLFCNTKNDAKEVLKKIKKDGINIVNLEELGRQWKAIKIGGRQKR